MEKYAGFNIRQILTTVSPRACWEDLVPSARIKLFNQIRNTGVNVNIKDEWSELNWDQLPPRQRLLFKQFLIGDAVHVRNDDSLWALDNVNTTRKPEYKSTQRI